jgi:hypothetical protein
MLCRTEPENLPHRGLAIDVAAALGERRDRELVRVLERMLEPDPDRRLSDLDELIGLQPNRRAGPTRDHGAGIDGESARPEGSEGEAAGAAPRAPARAEPAATRPGGCSSSRCSAWVVASIVVSAVLLVAAPLVLTLLSVFFGPRLRNAAAAVRSAGHASNRSLARARDRLMARGVDDEPRNQARVARRRLARNLDRGSREDEATSEPPSQKTRRATR